MVSGQMDEFLKLVDAKFAGQIPPNGPNDDDPRRLTLGFSQCTGSVTFTHNVHRLDWESSTELAQLVVKKCSCPK